MKIVNIQAAKTHLSRLVEEAAAGEQIVLAKAGRPLVQLTPFNPQPQPRKLGRLKGRVRETKECWDRDAALEAAFSENPVISTRSRRVSPSRRP